MAWMDSIADLPVHSCFSDGTMTPAELLDAAAARGVGLLALTDHDLLEGARALRDLPGKRGVSCVSGVELDAMDFGLNFHILGYGVDLDDPCFQAFCRENRERLEEVNRRLIVKMERAGEPVSLAEYEAFTYEPMLALFPQQGADGGAGRRPLYLRKVQPLLHLRGLSIHLGGERAHPRRRGPGGAGPSRRGDTAGGYGGVSRRRSERHGPGAGRHRVPLLVPPARGDGPVSRPVQRAWLTGDLRLRLPRRLRAQPGGRAPRQGGQPPRH